MGNFGTAGSTYFLTFSTSGKGQHHRGRTLEYQSHRLLAQPWPEERDWGAMNYLNCDGSLDGRTVPQGLFSCELLTILQFYLLEYSICTQPFVITGQIHIRMRNQQTLFEYIILASPTPPPRRPAWAEIPALYRIATLFYLWRQPQRKVEAYKNTSRLRKLPKL
jgi:hypothetical protein